VSPSPRLVRAGLIALLIAVLAIAVYVVVSHHRGTSSNTAPPPPARKATPITGWLHTSGTHILSASGAPVRLLGLDEPSMISGEGNNVTTAPDACDAGWSEVPATEYGNFREFGFNSVRLGVSWANIEPDAPSVSGGRVVHDWDGPYLQALDAEVRGFTSHGIAVILDMHQNNTSPAFKSPKQGRCEGSGIPAWMFPNAGQINAHRGQCDFLTDVREPGAPLAPWQGYEDVWRMLAARYAGNRMVVAADMFNEPSSHCGRLNLVKFYSAIGRTIRSVSPHMLLIYQDNAARRHQFALKGPLPLPNSVYSFHVYATSWTQAEATLNAHVAHSASWRVPIWLGEFGVQKQPGPDSNVAALVNGWPSVLKPFMTYCREHDIGWAFHQYAGGGTSLLLPKSGKPRTTWLAELQAGF
jgi:hypothetical protein